MEVKDVFKIKIRNNSLNYDDALKDLADYFEHCRDHGGLRCHKRFSAQLCLFPDSKAHKHASVLVFGLWPAALQRSPVSA